MLSAGRGQLRKHSKTFTGCWTCRSRKVKCDQARPACNQCIARRIECQGYGVRLRWMPPEQTFAAPGLDEDEEQSQSASRKSQRSHIALDPHQHVLHDVEIDDVLNAIDGVDSIDDPIIIHNFGVFSTLASAAEDELRRPLDSASSPNSHTASTLPEYPEDILDYVASGGHDAELRDTDDLPRFDSFSEDDLAFSNSFDLTNDQALWKSHGEESAPLSLPEEYADMRLRTSRRHHQWQTACGAIVRNPSPTHLTELEQFLMYHYSHRVVHLFCVIDNHRSPWKTIHLPRALQSTGQLNIEGSSTRIRDSLRNALLSISAFFLANDSRSRMSQDEATRWTAEAILFRGRAIQLLKDAVNNDFQKSPPKYKEFLATMLSMISINVMSGDTSTCGVHLDGAFRLMSQARTWKSKYSTKARSLHRIYFYLRTIYESTAVGSTEDAPLVLQSSDDVRSHWPQPDITQIVGIGDTDDNRSSNVQADARSLESSTRMTTYECIYGVPQVLLLHLWNTTNLINELSPHSSIPETLADRCDDLERLIMDWSPPSHAREDDNPRAQIIHHTTLAFHAALTIYFAQSVRHLPHHYLQPYVQTALASIEAIERIKNDAHILAAPLYWPAFIAASEAHSSEALQARFRRWYDSVEMYGIAAVRTGREVLMEVWREGRERKGSGIRREECLWRGVVRRTGAKLMLS